MTHRDARLHELDLLWMHYFRAKRETRPLTPIPGARRYSIDLSDDPPTIYTDRGHPRSPNHKKAVAIWCDDGVRRCRTLARWAALATLGAQIDRCLKILDPDRRSQMADRLALDDF